MQFIFNKKNKFILFLFPLFLGVFFLFSPILAANQNEENKGLFQSFEDVLAKIENFIVSTYEDWHYKFFRKNPYEGNDLQDVKNNQESKNSLRGSDLPDKNKGSASSGSSSSQKEEPVVGKKSIDDWLKKMRDAIFGKNGNSETENQFSQQNKQGEAPPSGGGEENQPPIGGSSSGWQQSGNSGNNDGGEDNGTPARPYKLEPNQFKKLCGQNTYVLFWRIGGQKGLNMSKPPSQGGGGDNKARKVFWELPTCEELARCHCCCNTCVYEPPLCSNPGFTFADPEGCYPQDKCTQCKPLCNAKCKSWSKPTPPPTTPLNRDCACQQEGCPKPAGNKCRIIIQDPGKTRVDYTKRDGKAEQYFNDWLKTENGQRVVAMFENGNGPDNPRSKISSEGADIEKGGWVTYLQEKPGVCCKCFQDDPKGNTSGK